MWYHVRAAKNQTEMAVGQNPIPLENIKIDGKWVFILSYRLCPMGKCLRRPRLTEPSSSTAKSTPPRGAPKAVDTPAAAPRQAILGPEAHGKPTR